MECKNCKGVNCITLICLSIKMDIQYLASTENNLHHLKGRT